ncbi:hypothetical protein SAMN05421837_11876 [Amycolatopsis pretoriensis]|uniref:Uncharacterized protein n=1 Tax=Amycolatopsis pretoriensis TaxID=218821 RepID=A0A1H5RIE1_9PSEU|nr:hypothetical protein [Amycolatopsis pretoriensis]SEF38125.1 hypothetical protein SAMN05421837_11876 [Amycolatopsis pretoriensis]
MTPTMACPCGVAVLGIVEADTDPETAIAAYERAAFQALAVGARFYVRYHDTDHSPAEAAPGLDLIARQSRIAHARVEQLVQALPAGSYAPSLAGQLRSHALEYGRLVARLYREAERLDAGPHDRLPDGTATPGDNAQGGS